jgi:hypothetical protein
MSEMLHVWHMMYTVQCAKRANNGEDHQPPPGAVALYEYCTSTVVDSIMPRSCATLNVTSAVGLTVLNTALVGILHSVYMYSHCTRTPLIRVLYCMYVSIVRNKSRAREVKLSFRLRGACRVDGTLVGGSIEVHGLDG